MCILAINTWNLLCALGFLEVTICQCCRQNITMQTEHAYIYRHILQECPLYSIHIHVNCQRHYCTSSLGNKNVITSWQSLLCATKNWHFQMIFYLIDIFLQPLYILFPCQQYRSIKIVFTYFETLPSSSKLV